MYNKSLFHKDNLNLMKKKNAAQLTVTEKKHYMLSYCTTTRMQCMSIFENIPYLVNFPPNTQYPYNFLPKYSIAW